MAIKTIEYVVNVAGITPATEQFGGTQGDHRVTDLIFTISSGLSDAIAAAAGDGKVAYRFDIYDGEGGVWSGASAELDGENVSIALEERHTRLGGKITVYLVITVLSDENDTEIELYSFPARLRLNEKPEGIKKDGENYESITTLAEFTKLKADEAANTVDEAVKRLEETAKSTFGKSAYQVAIENGFVGTEDEWLSSLKGEKGDKGDAFTYDDLTDEQKAELKEGIEQCVADQAYDPESQNAQSGIAVAEAVSQRIPKPVAYGAPVPRLLMLKANVEAETADGMMPDSAFDFQAVDDGNYNTKIDVASAANMIPTRDSKGNLWTGEPAEDEDCVNYKYANQHYVELKDNIDYAPLVYVQPEGSYPGSNTGASVLCSDRTDGYMHDTEDGGALSDGDLKEFGGCVARRQNSGNLLSGAPIYKYDVANKEYVDGLIGDIEALLGGI